MKFEILSPLRASTPGAQNHLGQPFWASTPEVIHPQRCLCRKKKQHNPLRASTPEARNNLQLTYIQQDNYFLFFQLSKPYFSNFAPGELPEWSNGAVSKTVVRLRRTKGSNPLLSAKQKRWVSEANRVFALSPPPNGINAVNPLLSVKKSRPYGRDFFCPAPGVLARRKQ